MLRRNEKTGQYGSKSGRTTVPGRKRPEIATAFCSDRWSELLHCPAFQTDLWPQSKESGLMIKLQCPSCSKSYQVKDAAAGKRFKCKKCGETVTVPEAKSSGGSSSRKQRPAAPATKKPKPQPEYDEYEEDYADDGYEDYESYDDGYGDDGYDEYDEPAPKRSASRKSSSGSKSKGKSKPAAKKKKKSGDGVLSGLAIGFNINRINGILAVVGGMLIFFGIQETRLSAMAKSEPTQMTLQELIEKGSPDNIYLTLTDVHCILDETVLYGDENGGRITKVDRAWIPATMPGGGQVKLIIKCTKANTENEVAGIASQNTFTGMVINQIDSINAAERKLLASGLPGTDLEKAYIFHERRTPSGTGIVILYYVGGLILLGAGLFWIFLVHP